MNFDFNRVVVPSNFQEDPDVMNGFLLYLKEFAGVNFKQELVEQEFSSINDIEEVSPSIVEMLQQKFDDCESDDDKTGFLSKVATSVAFEASLEFFSEFPDVSPEPFCLSRVHSFSVAKSTEDSSESMMDSLSLPLRKYIIRKIIMYILRDSTWMNIMEFLIDLKFGDFLISLLRDVTDLSSKCDQQNAEVIADHISSNGDEYLPLFVKHIGDSKFLRRMKSDDQVAASGARVVRGIINAVKYTDEGGDEIREFVSMLLCTDLDKPLEIMDQHELMFLLIEVVIKVKEHKKLIKELLQVVNLIIGEREFVEVKLGKHYDFFFRGRKNSSRFEKKVDVLKSKVEGKEYAKELVEAYDIWKEDKENEQFIFKFSEFVAEFCVEHMFDLLLGARFVPKYVESLSDEEKGKIHEFDKLIKEYRSYSPKYCKFGDYYRYLYGWEWDLEKAKESILKMLDWRMEKKIELLTLADIEEVAKSGFIYNFGETKDGHSVIYLKMQLDTSGFSEEIMNQKFMAVVYFFERAIRSLNFDCCRTVWIIDMKNYSIGISSVKSYIGLFSQLGDYYAERMDKTVIINYGMTVSFIWRVVKPFLYESTKKKYAFISGNNRKVKDEFLKFIDESQLQKDFFGSAEYTFDFEKEKRAEKRRN